MKKLIIICVVLSGLQYAITGMSNDVVSSVSTIQHDRIAQIEEMTK